MSRLVTWLEAKVNAPPPVPGWLTQGLLLVAFGIATWKGVHPQATTYLVGALVIGTVRQIYKDWRDKCAR